MKRVRPITLVLTSLLIAACSSSTAKPDGGAIAQDGGAEAGDAGPAVELRVDSFNIGLAGSFVPNEAVRRPSVIAALANAETDVLCIQEAWSKSDKEAIIAAAKVNFPYEVHFETDLDTAVTENKDINGATPPAYTTAPCVTDQAEALAVGLDCLKDNCSTIPGSLDGMATSTECAKAKCAGSAVKLLFAAEKRCYGCFAASLPTSTFNEMKTECTTNVHGGLAYKGQSGILMLSRVPLSGAEQFVLPGTWTRRTVAKATAKLANSAEVDLYCTHLSPYFSDPTFYPYTGQFGAGDDNGWIAEQALQGKQLVSWVSSKSGTKRAIVMGDLNATPEDKAHGIGDPGDAGKLLPAYGAKTLAVLASFQEAVSASYVPSCTFCVANHNTDGDQNSWIDHIFLSSFAPASTVSAKRTFDEDIVDGMRRADDGSHTVAGKVPLSDHYGVRAVVRVTP